MPVVIEGDHPARKHSAALAWAGAALFLLLGSVVVAPLIEPVEIRAGGHALRLTTNLTANWTYSMDGATYPPQGFHHELPAPQIITGRQGQQEDPGVSEWSIRWGRCFYWLEVR